MRRAEFTIGEADYLSAMRRFTRLAYRKRWVPILLLVVWLIYFAAFNWPFDQDWLRIAVGAGLATLVTAGLVGLLVGLNALILPRRVRRLYSQHRQLRLPQIATWDDGAIDFRSDAGANRIAWGDFTKWDDSGRELMLYANDLLFYIIPYRATDEGQRADIVAALTGSGVPRA